MSLWLQSSIEALENGDYKNFKENLLPCAPISLPGCLLRELEFAERCCVDLENNRLFPIRFIWVLEANEQKLFNLSPLVRSHYHPEKLLALWDRAVSDINFRQELEDQGFQFNFHEKAVQLIAGWIYIGDHFIDDFIAIESMMEIEMLFPENESGERRVAFPEFKHSLAK